MAKKQSAVAAFAVTEGDDVVTEDIIEVAASTVRMTRHPGFGEPTTADVHPDEIENYRSGGWEVA
jgi:hypothetical protein